MPSALSQARAVRTKIDEFSASFHPWAKPNGEKHFLKRWFLRETMKNLPLVQSKGSGRKHLDKQEKHLIEQLSSRHKFASVC